MGRLGYFLKITILLALFPIGALADQVISGNLKVEVIDYISHKTSYKYYLQSAEQDPLIPLRFTKQQERELVHQVGHSSNLAIKVTLRSNHNAAPSRLQVRHSRLSNRPLIVSSYELSSDNSASELTTFGNITGVRKVAVFVVNIKSAGKKKTSVLTTKTAKPFVFTAKPSVKGIFEEASHGKFSIYGDVYGTYTIDSPSFSCEDNYSSWQAKVDAQVKAAKIDTSSYSHLVYVLPHYSQLACPWAGRAILGGKVTWIAYNHINVFAHEMGHNFGLWHAGVDLNQDGVISGINESYADNACIMGLASYGGFSHYNGIHKFQLGWSGNSVKDISASTNGVSYLENITALEVNPSTSAYPQIISVSPVGRISTFYISFRKNFGTYSNLSASGGLPDTVHIESMPYELATSIRLAALANGQLFTDKRSGISVKVVGINGNNASLQIDFGAGDFDGDGLNDSQDLDDDNDGVADLNDCAQYNNKLYYDTAYPDLDLDGFRDSYSGKKVMCYGAQASYQTVGTPTSIDNCPSVANPDQRDSDQNGVGDLCQVASSLSSKVAGTTEYVWDGSKVLGAALTVADTKKAGNIVYRVSGFKELTLDTPLIPVDPSSQTFQFGADFRVAQGPYSSYVYLGLIPYDKDAKQIYSVQVMRDATAFTINSVDSSKITSSSPFIGDVFKTDRYDCNRYLGFYFDGLTERRPDALIGECTLSTLRTSGAYSLAVGDKLYINKALPSAVTSRINYKTKIMNHMVLDLNNGGGLFVPYYVAPAAVVNLGSAAGNWVKGIFQVNPGEAMQDWAKSHKYWPDTRFVKPVMLINQDSSMHLEIDNATFRQTAGPVK